MPLTNPPEYIVRYSEGPKCPICHQTIMLQCTVKIKSTRLRITGGDSFSSHLAASVDAEVTSVVADHNCKPKKDNS